MYHAPLILALGIGAAVVLTACRRKPVVLPDAPPTVAPVATPVPAPTPAPPAGSPSQAVSTIETKDAAYTLEMTQTLNDFLGDYIREKKRVPRDINEMISLKIITSIPVLPHGKKWVINQQTGKIAAQ